MGHMNKLISMWKNGIGGKIVISSSLFFVLCICCVSVIGLAPKTSTGPTRTPVDVGAVQTMAMQTVAVQLTDIDTQNAKKSAPIVLPTEVFLTETSSPSTQPTDSVAVIATDTQAPQATNTASVTGLTCIPSSESQKGKVVEVIDGDTIKVYVDGATYTVRYIGINAPENTKEVGYYGPEAARKNSELVYAKDVLLYKDVSNKDANGRLLRYVIADGVFVNLELIAGGFAAAEETQPDVACTPVFKQAEQKTSAAKAGMWGAPPTVVYVAPPPAATSQASSSSGASGASSSSGASNNNSYDSNGDGKVTCADFQTHSAAQAAYNAGQSQLDGNDKDGKACESLP
jgi:micrococcal nuclease